MIKYLYVMKQKLKLLLAYFRAFKTENLHTFINLIWSDIENWDEIFKTNKGKEIEISSSMLQIFEDVIKTYMRDFHRYNNYDNDDFWTLIVNIYPKENRINFQSECKVKRYYDKKSMFNISAEHSELNVVILNNINEIFEEELPEENYFEFTFDGEYDEINVDFDFDVSDESLFTNLTDNVMRTVDTRWWMDDGGAQGIIKIKKDESLIVDWVFRDYDYQMTLMNINVTPDNIKE
tara:strand:- start:1657 stop:2361 length:705 start_codon:yes stop_codon:yes gene_type:complete